MKNVRAGEKVVILSDITKHEKSKKEKYILYGDFIKKFAILWCWPSYFLSWLFLAI